MTPVPPARHHMRAKDLVDARYREPLDVRALAAYRATHPPTSDRARIPTCVLRAWARPQSSSFGEDNRTGRG
jgi:hypothetical protein